MAERDHEAARERVSRLVRAAGRLRDPEDPLGARLRQSTPSETGLSREGVELALLHCLEVSPSEEEVERLCASVPEAPRAHVILSSNVFVAAHRAIALGLAASAQVVACPSRRDPVFAECLYQAAPELFSIARTIRPQPGDHVWAYGHDETIAQIASNLPAGAVLHAHGSGIGACVIQEGYEDPVFAAQNLALDVALFDQRGCLSPRAALLSGSTGFCREFVRLLAHELAELERRVPRGDLSHAEEAELCAYRDALIYAGGLHEAGRGLIGLDLEPRGVEIAPVGRNLHVVRASDPCALLRPMARHLTGLGVSAEPNLVSALAQAFPRARIAALGRMQTPPFDGPVDRREHATPASEA